MRRFFGLVLAGLMMLSCADRLQPPTVTADHITITKISPDGVEIDSTLDALNPNKAEVTATTIQSKVTIGGKPDVAAASVSSPLVLASLTQTKVKMPLHITWKDHAALAALAATGQPAPYVVEGTVEFRGAGGTSTTTTNLLIKGMLSADDLAKASGKSGSASGSAAPSASASAAPSGSASAKPPGAHK